MVDEITDVSNKEQLVNCFHWVDSNLEVHEEFAGLSHVESTQALVIVTAVHDFLQRYVALIS